MYNIIIIVSSILVVTAALVFAAHFLPTRNLDLEKASPYECGFDPLKSARVPFSFRFFLVAILFLLFDLEILLVYPYVVSAYTNGIYGLIMMLVFFLVLTLGFVFELGKNALKIDSRQMNNLQLKNWKQTIYIK